MPIIVRRAGDTDYPRFIKMLICGAPGSGKTRFASTAPNILYANAEGGMMSVIDRQPGVVDISSSSELHELRVLLDQDPDVREKMIGFPVETVCIDTIDEVARMLIRERCDAQKKEAMAMQDWGWLGDQLRGIVRSFRNLDLNVIFNVHLKSQEDTESGRTVHVPAIPGAMGDEIPGYVDLALLLTARKTAKLVDGGKTVSEVVRFFQSYPDANHVWVKDRSGKLPLEFVLNLDDDFKRLDSIIYGNQPTVVQASATVVPTKPQGTIPTEPEPEPDPEPPMPDPVQPLEPEPSPIVPEPETPPETMKEDLQDTGSVSGGVTPQESNSEPQTLDPEDAPDAPVKTAKRAPKKQSTTGPWECADCEAQGKQTLVEDVDQKDLSLIRFRRVLCRPCFTAAKKAKA